MTLTHFFGIIKPLKIQLKSFIFRFKSLKEIAIIFAL